MGPISHFGAFLILAAYSAVALGRSNIVILAAGLCVFAVTSEILQLFTRGRSADFSDLAYNGAGILAGLAIGAAVIFLAGRLRRMRA